MTRAATSAGLRCAIALLCVVAVTFSGCGRGETENAKTTESIVKNAPPLKDVLITPANQRRFPPDSVQRRFLSFWSALQFQALREVVNSYHPDLVREVGLKTLVSAIRFESAYLRSVKPRIERLDQSAAGTTVYYVVKDSSGNETPRSISFEHVGGVWEIVYDSFLDFALRDSVQVATQAAIDPNVRTSSKEAVRAGYEASQLQSRFLDRLLRQRATNEGRAP